MIKISFTGEDGGFVDIRDDIDKTYRYAVGPNGALYIIESSAGGPSDVASMKINRVYGPATWHQVKGPRLRDSTLLQILG